MRAYGALILSALEKQDAETLSALRATQELDIQTRMLDVKTRQVTEAQDQITALQNQQAVVQIRYDFYSNGRVHECVGDRRARAPDGRAHRTMERPSSWI